MTLSKTTACIALTLMLVALLLGTQMPGNWRDELEYSLHAPFQLSSWAHFFIFSAMAFLSATQPLAWPLLRVLTAALALALLTEGLQFFALSRHPGLDDVAIDMAGAAFGLLLTRWQRS